MKNKVKRHRRTIEEEISHTQHGAPHETVVLSVSITRALYLHALKGVAEGDYTSISTYLSDLIRRDKHWRIQVVGLLRPFGISDLGASARAPSQ